MTLVFPPESAASPRKSPPRPGTHILIIGVGGYSYLNGGDREHVDELRKFDRLGQLTSPPRSALAFEAAVLSVAPRAWTAPLATVQTLISPAPADPQPGGSRRSLAEATHDAIQTAFSDWKRRCDSHEDNVAIFYFCGHGLQNDQQILLASDFGRFPDAPFKGAFGFERTRDGFEQCKASTQCFFVDACRETPLDVLQFPNKDVPGLIDQDASYRPPDRQLFRLVIRAAATRKKAFAPPNDVSYFTKALIRAMKGAAGYLDERGRWAIFTDRLAARVPELLVSEIGPSGRHQIAAPEVTVPTTLFLLDHAPTVILEVNCDPTDAQAVATLRYVARDHPPVVRRRFEPAPWTVEVAGGFYFIDASFGPGDIYNRSNRDILALPPRHPEILEVLKAQ
jgi:hypothetical protein